MPTSNDQDARLLTWLAQQLHDGQDVDDTVARMLSQARTVAPGAHHVGVTVRARRGTYRSIGSTSPLARHLDDLQHESGEGPCVDAASPGGDDWSRSSHLGDDRRWPRWAAQAEAVGVRSVLCAQLLDRGEPFGAITLYSEDSGRFGEDDAVGLALLWIAQAAIALSTARRTEGLQRAIDARHTIGVAQGILMQRLDLDEEAAFEHLLQLASTREEGIGVLAAKVVRTGDVPRH
ncbi:GAF and ANTAR domain-containing protein [Nocardioides sp. CFH 31398]|uniref:GAF and ANTAR domain-containing protein n=1 Tax=Nocardioides sp. CFH 31398 TaxID=2919579 RepID=UPI001F06C321|nr:GAF and ANTAR domain-containing protein [Nocardioides sp. CFH 31398]MCH1866633.1 GAF and ANTAR domain-containing protein [Nocardioides sp. CFH 31398]